MEATANKEETIERLPGFGTLVPGEPAGLGCCFETGKGGHRHHLLTIPSRQRLQRILRRLLDENEFLSPHGIRALSLAHRDRPYSFRVGGEEHRVEYVPGESNTRLFGGNSNRLPDLPRPASSAGSTPVVALREFLRCSLLDHGFARLWYGECRRSVLVAFSCRGRSFCPSCEKKKQLLCAEWPALQEWDGLRLMTLFRERLLARLVESRAISKELVARPLGKVSATISFRGDEFGATCTASPYSSCW